MLKLTSETLARLFPRARPALLDAVAATAPGVLSRFRIDVNADRLGFFLAQIGHESGGMTTDIENLRYSAQRMTEVWPRRFPTLASAAPFANDPEALGNLVYGGRMGNGPPSSGDGFRFRGRGLIQITGREAYAAVGARADLALEADPDLAMLPENALLCAAAFWQWKNLNPVCDAGDFTQCTIIINGGITGIAERRQWLDKVRRVLAEPPPVVVQPPPELVIRVQKALFRAGFTGVGAADGFIGRRTAAAITAFRKARGLRAGSIDAALLTALGVTP